MTTAPDRRCHTSEVDHVRRFVAYAKHHVNKTRYYPPLNGYRYMVALALYSKCFTVAEATMALLDTGFDDEAFGMTRTLTDIYITLRYIANQDTEERSKLYYNFVAKDVAEWQPVVKDFWPQLVQRLDPRLLPAAPAYRSPHRWSGKSAKDMALEPDTHELDAATGKPAVHDFDYRVIYRWTSHYVHPTIVALRNHLVTPGHDPFVIRSGHDQDIARIVTFNIAVFVAKAMISFYRCMGDPQPSRVGTWASALLSHLAKRHN